MDSNTIMDSLKDELDTIQSSTSPYKSDIAEIMRGIHGHTDTVNRPFIGIAVERDEVDQGTFDTTGLDSIWRVHILLYCYMKPSLLGNYDDMYQLITDLKYFFKYNWSHASNTFVKSVSPVEGGVTVDINYFDMMVEVIYQENI